MHFFFEKKRQKLTNLNGVHFFFHIIDRRGHGVDLSSPALDFLVHCIAHKQSTACPTCDQRAGLNMSVTFAQSTSELLFFGIQFVH